MQWMVAVTLVVYWGLVIWVLVRFQVTCNRSVSDNVSGENDTDPKE